jgi:hypothetical protein
MRLGAGLGIGALLLAGAFSAYGAVRRSHAGQSLNLCRSRAIATPRAQPGPLNAHIRTMHGVHTLWKTKIAP